MTKRNDKFTREARRADAEKRQAEHDKLSIDQKIAKAAGRPGESNREIVRLGVQAGIYTDTVTIGGKKRGVHRSK